MSPLHQLTLALGGAAVLAWRIRETRSPVTARRILLPPLGMSTGFLIFVVPSFRIPWSWAMAGVLGSLILSIPLVRSSSLERRGDAVMLRRSNALLVIVLGLLTLRIALHKYVARLISPPQTVAVFFVLAFGMIARWRVALFLRLRALEDGAAAPPGSPTDRGPAQKIASNIT